MLVSYVYLTVAYCLGISPGLLFGAWPLDTSEDWHL